MLEITDLHDGMILSTLSINSHEFVRVEPRLRGSILCSKGVLDESPTSANLGNDHEFIIKECHLHWCEAVWGSPNQSHESLYSKWTISYHCREVHLTHISLSTI